MALKTVELSVGAFVVAGLVALFVLAFQVSGINRDNHHESYTLFARFDNVSGLKKRAKVSVAGVVIGRVTSIRLDADDYQAVVSMAINEEVNFLTTDCIAAIQTAGILGEKYIGISIGGEEEVLGEGDEIEDTASAIVLEELIGNVLASFPR